MSAQVELYREALKIWNKDLALSTEEVAERAGLRNHQLGATERNTIDQARLEVLRSQDSDRHYDREQGHVSSPHPSWLPS